MVLVMGRSPVENVPRDRDTKASSKGAPTVEWEMSRSDDLRLGDLRPL